MPADLADNFIHKAYLWIFIMFTSTFEDHAYQTEKKAAPLTLSPRGYGPRREPSREVTLSQTSAANYVDTIPMIWTTVFGIALREQTSGRPSLRATSARSWGRPALRSGLQQRDSALTQQRGCPQPLWMGSTSGRARQGRQTSPRAVSSLMGHVPRDGTQRWTKRAGPLSRWTPLANSL
jgi:hypothetical protein